MFMRLWQRYCSFRWSPYDSASRSVSVMMAAQNLYGVATVHWLITYFYLFRRLGGTRFALTFSSGIDVLCLFFAKMHLKTNKQYIIMVGDYEVTILCTKLLNQICVAEFLNRYINRVNICIFCVVCFSFGQY